MEEHQLLIRHALKWAESKQRTCDADLLETALELRSVHDELEDTYWPEGAVEDLMLVRWPSHGPLEAPDPDAVAGTLDTFVHFLRATGRMMSGSADPKSLAREARRAAPKMLDACADAGAHSQSKVLLGFAAESGIDLSSADSMEELQSRLDEVMNAWNALPQQERVARMPLTSNAPNAMSLRVSEMFGGSGGFFDPKVAAGLLARDDGWDDGWDDGDEFDDTPLEPSDPALSAEAVRASGFIRSCRALLDWIGAGRAVTRTGVLRPAVAEAAFTALGLAEWDARWELASRRALDGPSPTAEELEAASIGFIWKSAGQCLPLDRLWWPLQVAGDIETTSSKATVVPRTLDTDEEWVVWGLTLLIALLERVEDDVELGPLVHLLGAGVLGGEAVRLDDLRPWWATARSNPNARIAESVPDLASTIAHWSDRSLALTLHVFGDTGIWTRDGDTFELTPFGRDFALVFFRMLEDGAIEL